MSQTIFGVGNIYLETNFLGLETGGSDILTTGKEYRSKRYEIGLGGSVVNFLNQLQKLDVSVGLIGKIGDDEPGQKVLTLLTKAAINTQFVIRSNTVQTSIDTGLVFTHNGDNIQLVSGNANQNLTIDDLNVLEDHSVQMFGIYFGGFFKQESLFRDYPRLFKKLAEKNTHIFLDHGRLPVDVSQEKLEVLYQIFPYIDCYFPNETELQEVAGIQDVEEAAKKIMKLGSKCIIVKLGKNGAYIQTPDRSIHVSGYPVEVMNVVGAGDCFNAGFISQHIVGKTPEESAIFANAVAAMKVSTNQIPLYSDVNSFIKKHSR